MKDCMEIINTRSSIRKYTAEPLPCETVRELVEAGLKAPTAANRQELHFTVVGKDDPVQAEIQKDLKPDAAGNFYYSAPITIYISGDEA
ncbi:MAG: nitroreductase family protein, partial [Erysipelotrichaceae bacterium]|nr:nitroreductase family protein [Erysipelotrichaceae bacterium]